MKIEQKRSKMLRANLRLNRQFKTTTNEEMTKRGIIFLFNNTEECEFVIATDVLRRAGVDLKIVGVEESLKPIKGCQNIVISPEEELSKCESELYDVVVIPGGPGADNLSHEPAVGGILKKHFEANKIVAAICGGTKLLKSFNVAKGKRITTFPKYREDLAHGYQIQDKNVEIDENLITSQGPATAFDFAFSIVGQLFGAEKMNQVAEQIGFNSVIKREQ